MKPTDPLPKLLVTRRDDWRAWLQKHCSTKKEIWLIFRRNETGRPSLPYNDAVEEALCFGWIDGMVRKLDDEQYLRRFSPRRPRSCWSDLNIARAERMIEAGRMTPSGLALYRCRDKSAPSVQENSPRLQDHTRIPADLSNALRANPKAWETWQAFAPSHKRRYLAWLNSAKRPETRARRINEAVGLITNNVKSLMK